jgi:ABC-type Zn2+ transport system substrate-binding protein/surface adhesin
MPAMAADHHQADQPGHADAVVHHRTDDHGEDHGHDDHAHGDGDTALGPLDPYAWGAGLLGVGVAIVIAVCFAFATSG